MTCVSHRSTPQSRFWGNSIRRLRIERCLTQEQLAVAIVEMSDGGVSLDRSAVARWESGQSTPALRYRPYIAQVLETDQRLLFQVLPGEAA